MTRRIILLIACLLGVLPLARPARADDLTRAVQEALRTRELYYGDVNGAPGGETTEALRRFQAKKGLDPTGALDEATLRALGLLPPAGADAPGAERVDQCRDFIGRYLHACGEGDLGAELGFFADKVDYMDDGGLDKAALQADLAAYRRNWPERAFKLVHCVASPMPSNADELIATFRYQFDVRGGGHERKGIEDLNIVIRVAGGALKIISMREF